MNPSIDAYFASVYTASVFAFTIGVYSSRYYSMSNKCLCGDCRYIAYHDVSTRRWFTRTIAASLIFVNSSSASAVMNEIHGQNIDSFSTIYMHVDVIYDFVWTWQYAASRSVSPTKMSFNIHLSYIHTTMWRTHMSLKSGLPIYLPILLWVC